MGAFGVGDNCFRDVRYDIGGWVKEIVVHIRVLGTAISEKSVVFQRRIYFNKHKCQHRTGQSR